MNPENQTKLIEIFRVILDVDDQFDVQSLRKMTEKRWDSLASTSLVVAIESEFGVRLDTADTDRMTSFAAVRLLLEEKGL